MSTVPTVLCFGEIVWDSAPNGLFLGGAPTNVAYHLRQLGAYSVPVSAVGEDQLGEEALKRIGAWGVPTSHIATLAGANTGIVQVDLTRPDQPTYGITDHAAWDSIPESNGLIATTQSAQAIVFGSLALRHQSNRQLLDKLLRNIDGLKVFDVNLRAPFFDTVDVLNWAKKADIIKLNEAELEILHPFAIGSIELMAAIFSQTIGGKKICVTCGSLGAGFWDGNRWYWAEAVPISVKGDAVGAGDAFLAALVTGLTAGTDIEQILRRCNWLASKVASRDGAQPTYDASFIAE